MADIVEDENHVIRRSHASDYDVAEQQRPAAAHDEVTMRLLRLPFEIEADAVDAIDQQRSVPIDEDAYR